MVLEIQTSSDMYSGEKRGWILMRSRRRVADMAGISRACIPRKSLITLVSVCLDLIDAENKCEPNGTLQALPLR